MDKQEYNIKREEVIKLYGVPIRGNGFEEQPNESFRMMEKLRMDYARSVRAKSTQDALELAKSLPPEEVLKTKYMTIKSIAVLEDDLKGFKGKERDIVSAWFENQNLSPKELAGRFEISYQSVAGLLRDRRVELLKAKYFNQTLEDNTKLALLKLTQNADPKIVLAAAEYLKLLANDVKAENNGAKALLDPLAAKLLSLAGDWLAGDMKEALTITKEDLNVA